MAVPKRKTSKARRDQRSSSWFIRPQVVAFCPEESCSGAPKLPHRVCLACGFYKGEKVLVTKNDRAEVRENMARLRAEYQKTVAQKADGNASQALIGQEGQ